LTNACLSSDGVLVTGAEVGSGVASVNDKDAVALVTDEEAAVVALVTDEETAEVVLGMDGGADMVTLVTD